MSEEDFDAEEESEGLILSIGDDGKASIYEPEDWVEMKHEEADLVKKFIDENKELWKKFVEKEKIK